LKKSGVLWFHPLKSSGNPKLKIRKNPVSQTRFQQIPSVTTPNLNISQIQNGAATWRQRVKLQQSVAPCSKTVMSFPTRQKGKNRSLSCMIEKPRVVHFTSKNICQIPV